MLINIKYKTSSRGDLMLYHRRRWRWTSCVCGDHVAISVDNNLHTGYVTVLIIFTRVSGVRFAWHWHVKAHVIVRFFLAASGVTRPLTLNPLSTTTLYCKAKRQYLLTCKLSRYCLWLCTACSIVVFIPFYWKLSPDQITKCELKHQYLQIVGRKLSKCELFSSTWSCGSR